MKRKCLSASAIILLLIFGSVLAISCAEKVGVSTQIIENITVQEASRLIQENQGNPDFTIIDVRTPEELADGYVENAVNINFNSSTFREDIGKLDKDKTYLIYCRSGNRSAQAAVIMKELGFREVYDMGGIIDWIKEGFPVVK